MAKLRFEVGAICDIGMKRANNEDNLFVPGQKIKNKYVNVYDLNKSNDGKPLAVDGKNNAFFAVCDGMGGHNGGEEASFMAVSAISDMYKEIIKPADYRSAVNSFEKLIDEISGGISYAADANPLLHGMGSTICGLYAFGDKVMPVNVGDSRVYMIKRGRIEKISMDHTDAVDGKGALTRYLGVPADMGAVTPYCGIEPLKILDKTRFLLCSDGLTDMLDDDKIEAILNKNKSPAAAAEELVSTAKKIGGDDNVTVEVIDVIPTSSVVKRRLQKPSTYIAAAAVIALVAAGGIVYNYFAPLMAPEYSGISLDISAPDKELVQKLNADVVTDELINKLDPSDPNYINPEDNYELQIKRLEKKLDADYPVEAIPDGSDAQAQKDAWAAANASYEAEKNTARSELSPLEELRARAFAISLKPEDGAEGGEDYAKKRSEERKAKADELQNKINEYKQKYFSGDSGASLYVAKEASDSAKVAYDTEVKRVQEARAAAAAEAERRRAAAEASQNNSGGSSRGSNGSSSGGSRSGGGSQTYQRPQQPEPKPEPAENGSDNGFR